MIRNPGPGIYLIKNKENGMVYVGKSENLAYRTNRHLLALRKGNHDNIYLQLDFDKYGEESFEFSILKEGGDLDRWESVFAHDLDAWDNGYNIAPLMDYRRITEEDAIRMKDNFLKSLFETEKEFFDKQRRRKKPKKAFVSLGLTAEKEGLSRDDLKIIFREIVIDDMVKYNAYITFEAPNYGPPEVRVPYVIVEVPAKGSDPIKEWTGFTDDNFPRIIT